MERKKNVTNALIVKKFCDYQVKCKEDTDKTWTCTAHLESGWAPTCSYSVKNLKKINGTTIMTHQGELVGCCQDWSFKEEKSKKRL